METKKIVSAKEAAAAIEDGSTVVVCGCENILLPDYLLLFRFLNLNRCLCLLLQ